MCRKRWGKNSFHWNSKSEVQSPEMSLDNFMSTKHLAEENTINLFILVIIFYATEYGRTIGSCSFI
jgi:hypothetical protein